MGRFINADAFTSTGQGMLGNNMFAYCNNNPILSYDASGCVPVSVVPIWDFYFIHRRVQEDIVYFYGYAMEVYVVKPNQKLGRMDLYDVNTNTFYEVKHRAAAFSEATQQQMSDYSNSTIVDWRFDDEIISVYDSPSPGTNNRIHGSFNYSIYTIEYQSYLNGVIAYTISMNESLITTAALTACIALGGGVFSLGCQQGGIRNPAFSTR